MDTVKRSRTSTVVLTANGEEQTHEEAHVFVHDLNLFVTLQLLDETPAVLSLGKLCEDHGYSYEGSAVKSHDWPKTGRVLSARRITSYLLSFQEYPPILKAVRLVHRHHRTRWEKMRKEQPGNWCHLLQVHLQVQYQSEVTKWQPRHWCHSQKFKTKKRGVTGRIRKIRWQIFLTG